MNHLKVQVCNAGKQRRSSCSSLLSTRSDRQSELLPSRQSSGWGAAAKHDETQETEGRHTHKTQNKPTSIINISYSEVLWVCAHNGLWATHHRRLSISFIRTHFTGQLCDNLRLVGYIWFLVANSNSSFQGGLSLSQSVTRSLTHVTLQRLKVFCWK